MISSLGTVFALFNNTILGEFSVPFKREKERESRVQSAEQDKHKKHIQGKERKGGKKEKH
jgi:hypothetical protein